MNQFHRYLPGIFALVQLAIVGWVDYKTGYEISLIVFYFLPVAYAAWNIGLVSSCIFAVASAATLTWTEVAAGRVFTQSWMAWEHGLMRTLVFGFVAFSFSYFRKSLAEERARVKRLEGLLCFCNRCMRIQDKEGNWNDLATLVRDEAGAQSRSKLCPECSRVTYLEKAPTLETSLKQ